MLWIKFISTSLEIALKWMTKKSLYWEVNIGSGNGLWPSGNKPLHEPLLTQICVPIWCHSVTMSWNLQRWKGNTLKAILLWDVHHEIFFYKIYHVIGPYYIRNTSSMTGNGTVESNYWHAFKCDVLTMWRILLRRTSTNDACKISRVWPPA